MKKLLNGVALIIGIGLVCYSCVDKRPAESPQTSQLSEAQQQTYEKWNLKPGSVYDGDTLRVIKGNEELKIRFCGIDAPEKKQQLGVEARDYLRSLIELGNGELLLVPIDQDRYGRTVAEVYVQDRKSSAINLNLQMVKDGYAWHYERYSGNCPSHQQFAIAQKLAQEEKLGIWKGSSIPPWEWRKTNK